MIGRAHNVACPETSASVHRNVGFLPGEAISLLSSVADLRRNIPQIRFNTSTTFHTVFLNRDSLSLHMNDTPCDEIETRLGRQGVPEINRRVGSEDAKSSGSLVHGSRVA